ncbi:cytochrome c oxidase assembly protein COX16 homolog, mitochondrial isoform X2 [Lagopus muta]|uniref:cytochrome c oxidase assembly protein COX16 homolog, mitochondrial isoform X2 n=1 Tax=Lagopus muta TaxID=64668 RepID=UPI00209DF5CB|nr:cytochrome c oxidase assembly protein COX16 homolog, mitochondrial isoform X2 [Lagopus muta]
MERLRKLWRGRTMTFGVPLLLYIVGGSFGLREFAQIRYDVHKLHGKENEDTISVLPGISYLGVLSKGCLLRMFWMVAHKVTLFGWLTVPVHIYSAGFPII